MCRVPQGNFFCNYRVVQPKTGDGIEPGPGSVVEEVEDPTQIDIDHDSRGRDGIAFV
jgi:hypothetical protein